LQSLSDAARTSGVQLAVVNSDRYLPSRQLIRQQLEQKIGELGLVRIHRWEAAAEWGTFWGFPSPVVRDIEMTMWLTGQTPRIVCAFEASGDACTGAGRTLQIHLGFSTGMALVDLAHLPDGDGYQSLSVIGASGAAYADDHQNAQLLYQGGAPQAVHRGEGSKHLSTLLQDFVDAIAGGRDLSATVAEWCHVTAVASAVRESLASRKAVPVSFPARKGT